MKNEHRIRISNGYRAWNNTNTTGNGNGNDDIKIQTIRQRYCTATRRKRILLSSSFSCSHSSARRITPSPLSVPFVLLSLPLLEVALLLVVLLLLDTDSALFVDCFSFVPSSSRGSSSRSTSAVTSVNSARTRFTLSLPLTSPFLFVSSSSPSPARVEQRFDKFPLFSNSIRNEHENEHEHPNHHQEYKYTEETGEKNKQETPNQSNSKTSKSNTKKNKRKKKIQWIACTSTKEVNRAIQMHLQKGDVVAELGSQLRGTSSTICETISNQDTNSGTENNDIDNNNKCGRAILVDIQRKYPKTKLQREDRTTAMRREGDEHNFYSNVAEFMEIPSLDCWRHALFFRATAQAQRQQYNALVVDVSTIAGNDLELTCISLVREFIALNGNVQFNEREDYGGEGGSNSANVNHNPCRVVIIKSGSLHQLARSLFHAQRLLPTHASTSTGTSSSVSLDDNPHPTSIIGTVGVEEYRKMIPLTVRKGDVVLEVGSHFGTTTALLHDAACNWSVGDNNVDLNWKSDLSNGGCIGVDVGPQIIESAKKKYPNVPFVVGDAWKMSDLIQMKDAMIQGVGRGQQPQSDLTITTTKRYGYDVVFVDVGGLSGSEGLLESLSLLSSITNSLSPRCIVIKSLCIRRLASSLVPFSQLWKEGRASKKK